MKRSAFVGGAGVAIFAALAYFIFPVKRQDQVREQDSPAGKYRIEGGTYDELAKAAQSGNCEAAYKLGRHHVFYTLNTGEAIKWYRLAARCPDARAKGELLGILMHFETEDAEVDKLLLEIGAIDPKAAVDDSAAVKSVRSLRVRTAH